MQCMRFCRKVRFFGQNPKILCHEFNDLQTQERSKKPLCDRTLNTTRYGLLATSTFSAVMGKSWMRTPTAS